MKTVLCSDIAPAAVVAFALLVGMVCGAEAETHCAGTTDTTAAQVKAATTSPLYALLHDRLGAPLECRASQDGSESTIEFRFPGDGRFALKSDDLIEMQSQEAWIPPAPQVYRSRDALVRLRQVEKQVMAPHGCQIRWPGLNAAIPSGELTLEGKLCNCRATLRTDNGAVVNLRFSTAC